MKKLSLCCLAVVALIGMASMASASEKWDKDNSAHGVQTRGLLNCSNAIDAGCGLNYNGNNANGGNNVSQYNCQPYTESGPEDVFRFVLGATSNVDIEMQTDGTDLDLFVLASCDENDCIASSAGIDHELVHIDCLDAGTYFIVVDGYNGNIGSYNLTINCVDCNPPAGNETCGTAADLGCGDISLSTNTNGTNNDYDPGAGNSCTGYSASGGDLVWSVCIPAGGSANLTFQELDYDSSIYLVSDCSNLVGSCLDGDDCYPWPCTDNINYTNGTGGNVNAYLIVDGFGGASGNGQLSGTVDCCGTTPTQTTSWGALKSILR